jgi:hypothetical protein
MLASKQIKKCHNSLRMTFSGADRSLNSLLWSQPSFDVSLENYIDRFDMTRPVFVALETFALERGTTPLTRLTLLCFDTLPASDWVTNPVLGNCLGTVLLSQYSAVSTPRVTSDSTGIVVPTSMLTGGGLWSFSIRVPTGALKGEADLSLGYVFTLVLYQKNE